MIEAILKREQGKDGTIYDIEEQSKNILSGVTINDLADIERVLNDVGVSFINSFLVGIQEAAIGSAEATERIASNPTEQNNDTSHAELNGEQ